MGRWLCGTAVAWYRLVVGTAVFWVGMRSTGSAAVQQELPAFSSKAREMGCVRQVIFLQSPSIHLSFPFLHDFSPTLLPLLFPPSFSPSLFFLLSPPGSSVCVKVHVRSVPTRFSPPTLVPLPCPELPRGDKCIEHPWPLCGRGQWAGDPAQPCRLCFLSLCVGQRAKTQNSPLRGVSVNTFVDKLKATLPVPCPFS